MELAAICSGNMDCIRRHLVGYLCGQYSRLLSVRGERLHPARCRVLSNRATHPGLCPDSWSTASLSHGGTDLPGHPLRCGVRVVLAAGLADFLAQITRGDGTACLADACDVCLIRLSGLQLAHADAPAFPTPGPDRHLWADVACHISLFLYLSHRALHSTLDMGRVHPFFRRDDARLSFCHRAFCARYRLYSNISPADR